MTKLVVGSATDVGLVRSNNQDQYLVAPGLYAVADGMGGHAAGEVASQTAIEALLAAFQGAEHRSPLDLVRAAKTANRAVWDQARANRGMLGMGTTLVALAVVEEDETANGMAIAHIGDSRAYLYRNGTLEQLTTDHSLVQELVDDGQITQDEAAVHPQRHVLTRALGVEPSVEVDLLHLNPQHGDRYLLCSDGLPREASSQQIAAILARFTDPSEAAKELVSLANSKGGSDNVTVVVVDVTANDPTGETLMVVPGPAASTGLSPHPPATGAAPAPTGPAPAPARPEARDKSRSDHHRATTGGGPRTPPRAPHRWLTLRVVVFLLVVCALLGGALAGLAWYGRSTYYIGVDQGRISIFQGRPGGVLWFQPTLAQRTKYTTKNVLSVELEGLDAGVLEPSKAQAQQQVAAWVAAKVAAELATRPPPTTTTLPRPAKHGKKASTPPKVAPTTAPSSRPRTPSSTGPSSTAPSSTAPSTVPRHVTTTRSPKS